MQELITEVGQNFAIAIIDTRRQVNNDFRIWRETISNLEFSTRQTLIKCEGRKEDVFRHRNIKTSSYHAYILGKQVEDIFHQNTKLTVHPIRKH